MADHEIATRAPESDAQEDVPTAEQVSGIPGDTTPDQGAASMGEHCTTDRPTPAGKTPTGELTKYDDIEVYVTKPADYPHAPSKLLLLLTGGTGVHSVNNQLQADQYAAEGFLVVMPDQFAGDPAPSSTSTTTNTSSSTSTNQQADQGSSSYLEQIKLGVVSVAKSFTIDMWLARHTPSKVLPILHRVLTSVREEFADAVANGGGVYAAGYCFGAKYVLLLGAEHSDGSAPGEKVAEREAEEGRVESGPRVKAGVIAHGTQISTADMEGMKVPVCVVAVKDDPLFPDHVREEGAKVMKANGVEHEVKVYEGVPHGFAVLGDYEDSKIVEKQEEAYQQMLAWLKAH